VLVACDQPKPRPGQWQAARRARGGSVLPTGHRGIGKRIAKGRPIGAQRRVKQAESAWRLVYGGRMKAFLQHRGALTGGLVLAVCSALLSPVGPTHADGSQRGGTGEAQGAHLDLGPADLPENRTVSALAPGVSRTKISRGGAGQS
jgi:hypothetical protein